APAVHLEARFPRLVQRLRFAPRRAAPAAPRGSDPRGRLAQLLKPRSRSRAWRKARPSEAAAGKRNSAVDTASAPQPPQQREPRAARREREYHSPENPLRERHAPRRDRAVERHGDVAVRMYRGGLDQPLARRAGDPILMCPRA